MINLARLNKKNIIINKNGKRYIAVSPAYNKNIKKLWTTLWKQTLKLDEIVKHVGKYNFLELTQEEIEYANTPLTIGKKLNLWLRFFP